MRPIKTLCLYHSRDLDGWMSAAIVKHYYEDYFTEHDLKLIGWDYGDPIPEEEIRDAEKVIMCDISFSRDAMIWLYNIIDHALFWIDHHKTAIELDKQLNLNIRGIRNSNKAACQLTWEYFFPHTKAPEIVWYLGMYDSFSHKGTEHETNVLRYQYAARAFISNPDQALWHLKRWDDSSLTSTMLHVGESIYEYLKKEAKTIYAKSFPIVIEGYKFLAVNRDRFNPDNFGIDYQEDGYDGFACFSFDGEKWTWSLYSNAIDVSKIAKMYGGGGHFGAAGMILNHGNSMFLLNKKL